MASRTMAIPADGCLGLLAQGALGLRTWRTARGSGPIPPSPRGVSPSSGKRRVLLIGWDAADWKVIHPLLDAGMMPTLAGLIDRGVIGDLRTLDPPLSPMLWTSIATGKTADEHGVLGFTEPTPDGMGLRPVHGSSRRCKALWNILQQEGLKSHVIGWWPSHPAEKLRGVTVSNFFHRAIDRLDEPWPLASDSVHPPELAEALASLRVHPEELSAEHLLPFVPQGAKIDQEEDRRLFMLAKVLADASSVHSAATWVMENEEWDFFAVYYDAIDHFGHLFMQFHPPRRKYVPEALFELYGGVVTAAYRFHDMMLERLLALAGDDATVLLVSDHGFHPDHLRPRGIPQIPAGPAVEHREHGILCLAGPGIRRDERVEGAGLLDIAPTVLNLFNLPVGRDMSGKVLAHAFEEMPEIRFVDSWESIEGDSGGYGDEESVDPWAEREAMRQLAELGYVDAPDAEVEAAIRTMELEARYYLGRVHASRGRKEEARKIYEALFQDAPEESRYAVHFFYALLEERRLREARTVFLRIRELLERREGGEGYGAFLDFLEGRLLFAEGAHAEALQCLRRAEKLRPDLPRLHLALGDVYLGRGRGRDAEGAYLRALDIDPDSAAAYDGLCAVYLRRRRWEAAAGAALSAIGLKYFFPLAHFRLGTALLGLDRPGPAAEAFEVSARQAPEVRRPRERLVELYRDRLGLPERAAVHLDALRRMEERAAAAEKEKGKQS